MYQVVCLIPITNEKEKTMTFESMGLIEPLQKALAKADYKNPTPIQAKTIPAALAGQDVLGCAQTGTGKTAAFALPTLDYLGRESIPKKPRQPLVLVLAPTRELAIQISQSFEKYGKNIKFRKALIYGGVSQHKQVSAIRRGAHVLIATPGRLVDLINQKHVSLSDIEVFILDEADRMMDMGFLPQLQRIIDLLPRERQSLFFSATMPPKIRDLAKRLLFNPKSINVTPKTPSVEGIDQQIYLLSNKQKLPMLKDLLARDSVDRAIVFTRTKRGANTLGEKLEAAGIPATAIHGNKSQAARQRALEAFRKNKIKVLVATDVASRGIDIDGVTHVFNYDMPMEPESYVHRIGRTGRAGADGVAISFCTYEDRQMLREIERLVKMELTIVYGEFDESRQRNNKGKSSSRKPGQRRRSRRPGGKSAGPSNSSRRHSGGSESGRRKKPGPKKAARKQTARKQSNRQGSAV